MAKNDRRPSPTSSPSPSAPPSAPAESVFVPSEQALERRSRRWWWIGLAFVTIAAVGAVGVMVYWPRFKPKPRDSDAVEKVAGDYLAALARQDEETARRLGTVEEPPGIASYRDVYHQKARDQTIRGSFCALAVLHKRIDGEFTYDSAAGRFTPKNPLGIAGETLDALHAAKDEAEKSGMYEKMKSGNPDDIFDAAEQYGKVFDKLAEGRASRPSAPADVQDAHRIVEAAAFRGGEGAGPRGGRGPQAVGRPLEAAVLDAEAGRPVHLRGSRGDGDGPRPAGVAGRPAQPAPAQAGSLPARGDRHRLEGRLGRSRPAGRRQARAATPGIAASVLLERSRSDRSAGALKSVRGAGTAGCRVLFEHRAASPGPSPVLNEHPTALRAGASRTPAFFGLFPSLQPPASQQFPVRHHAAPAMRQHPIVEHKSKIAVTGNDVHFFSDLQLRSRLEGDDGMLGGESGDRTVWIISENRRSLVLADGFLADVEDRPVGSGSADDGGQHGDGRSVALDVAGLGVVLAGEDPSAGLDLGDPGDIGGDLIASRIRPPR